MFIYKRMAQYHETDQMGIIHHSNYIKWMEEARVAFLTNIGFSYKKMEELGIISPVLEVNVSYKNPIKYEDIVEISLKINEYNGIKLEIGYELFVNNELKTIASSKHCFIKNNKIISLKKELKDFNDIMISYLNK